MENIDNRITDGLLNRRDILRLAELCVRCFEIYTNRSKFETNLKIFSANIYLVKNYYSQSDHYNQTIF